ncbi:2-aminoethylphosphonate ABC transporter ATP-binding protein (TC 3.A.1.9.1) [Klebsiella pneumoniae IS46]|nr:2-aminoethylphosphonate ABC transporter ATP-binding protein (TC 3.A.1.9.1) [Klebsiella pneumoniae IS46]
MLMKTTVTSSPSLAGTSGITLDSLRVSYHGNVVLKPLSLTIEPGEVLALIGPSGSGKTTVLRAIAGFVQPAGGRILIGDTDVTQLPPYKRGLAMVVQNYALFPHMKVEDNVAFGLRAQKQPRGLIAERVTEALKIVGMADYATRYPHQLSGGQQQRVAIAARLPCVLGCYCLMNRCRRWMRKFAITWWKRLPACIANCRSSPSSTSPTIRPKR